MHSFHKRFHVSKHGRFASFVAMCLLILPLLALVMMDSQVREANMLEVTGNSVYDFSGSDADTKFFAVVLLFLVVFAIIMIVSGHRKKHRSKKKKGSLDDIDSEIGSTNISLHDINSKL